MKNSNTKKQQLSLLVQFVIALSYFAHPAHAQDIPTVFGTVKVEDSLLLELINAPGFQRMKGVDQSGPVPYFVKGFPEFSRYDHSLGVFYLLNKFDAPYDEQVAGLLHDVSHTAFSHVAEHVFKHKDNETSYQDSIHLSAVKKLGLKKVTDQYQFDFAKLDHKAQPYPMLEQPGPDLCADRIEYLLHTG
ncbi:MAG: HD domain-containing protein, partial [Bacteroidota bacterium]